MLMLLVVTERNHIVYVLQGATGDGNGIEKITIEDNSVKDNPTERSEDKLEFTTDVEVVESALGENDEETTPQPAMEIINASQGNQMEVLSMSVSIFRQFERPKM